MANNRMFENKKFNLIGSIITSKEPVSQTSINTTSQWNKKTKMGIGIKANNSVQFLHMEYIHKEKMDITKILGKDNQTFEVKWEDTASQKTLDQAADFIKTTIDMETDLAKKAQYTRLIFKIRNHMNKETISEEDKAKIAEYTEEFNKLATNRFEFCHVKDVIEFLNKNIKLFEGKKVKISGDVKVNEYNNRLQFPPSLIEFVSDDTPEQLLVNADVFYDKDSIDDNEKERKMFISGYIGEKVNKQEKLFPINLVLDYTKINDSIPEQKELLDFMKDIFVINNKRQVHKIGLDISVVNGAEKKEFDASCLTERQKLAVMLGQAKIEDFKPKGDIFGEKVQELKVIKSNLKLYPEGSVEVFPIKELGDYIYIKEEKNLNNNTVEDNNEKTVDNSTLMQNLFG